MTIDARSSSVGPGLAVLVPHPPTRRRHGLVRRGIAFGWPARIPMFMLVPASLWLLSSRGCTPGSGGAPVRGAAPGPLDSAPSSCGTRATAGTHSGSVTQTGPTPPPLLANLLDGPEFLAGQFGVASPCSSCCWASGLPGPGARAATERDDLVLLACASAPVSFSSGVAFFSKVQANWRHAYLTAAVAAAGGTSAGSPPASADALGVA